jgi:hypothetical protein
MPSTTPPKRVFVSAGQRAPRGVLWATGAARFHAQRGGHRRGDILGAGPVDDPRPAQLDELRQAIRAYLGGRCAGTDWSYYRGRRLACPYRCALGSLDCPVDVLLVEINRPIAQPTNRPSARPPAAPGRPGS